METITLRANVHYYFTSKQEKWARAACESIKGHKITDRQFWDMIDKALLHHTRLPEIRLTADLFDERGKA